jgi:hypothetical protein
MFMNAYMVWVGAMAAAASLTSASLDDRNPRLPIAGSTSPCIADSSYQRLAFWIGDWDVYDSTGKHYARQRVHAVIDQCAITAEWEGGVGDKGIGISAYDVRTGDWKQVYVSNQVPAPSGIQLRRSDRSYDGPGVRFIPLLEPPPGNPARSRVTIMPLSGHRVMQLFENSSDGGMTWRTLFKAEHRSHS